MEYGIKFDLETPQGTVSFNDPTPGGFRLTGINGMDGATIRNPVENLPQRDGAIVFPFYRGARYPVLEGQIVYAGEDLTQRRVWEDELRGKTNSILRADGLLKWRPTGTSTTEGYRQMIVRLAEPLQIRGGLIKEFQLALVAGDPLTYSQEEKSQDTSSLSEGGATGGLQFPFEFPFSFGDWTTGGQASVTNGGNAPTYPTVLIHGPVGSPAIYNVTSGKVVNLPSLTLTSGDFAEVDMYNETIALNGGATSLLQTLDVANSEFWPLEVGVNDIRLAAATFVEASTSPTNEITNPGFEVDLTGWVPVQCTASRVTNVSHTGVASMKLVGTVAPVQYAYTQPTISGATLGRIYTASVWAKGEGTTIGQYLSMYMGEIGGATGPEFSTNSNILLTADWQQITVTYTLLRNDRTSIQIVPFLSTAAIGDVHYLDTAQLEEGAVLPPFEVPGTRASVVWRDAWI